jgi:hypothetical protein
MEKLQFKIISAVPEDRSRVDEVLMAAAARFELFDNSITSRVPDTIRSLVEKIGAGFGLGARVVGELIVLDFNPRGERSEKFSAVLEFITTGLQQIFGARLSIVAPEDRIPLNSTLPESPEAREFYREFYQKKYGKPLGPKP